METDLDNRNRGGATSGPPGDPGARHLPAWAVLAVAIVVALAAAGGIALLQLRAAQAHRVELRLLTLDELAEERQGVMWEGLATGWVGADPAADLQHADEEFDATWMELRLLDGGAATRVDAAVADLDAQLDGFLALVAAGRTEEASSLFQADAERPDRPFEAFRRAIHAELDAAAARAELAGRQGLVGTTLALVAAALAIGALFWRFTRAQLAGTAALSRNGARFRALIQHSTDVISLIDAEGTNRYHSPSLERVLGYRPEERAGRDGLGPLHPADLARVGQALREVRAAPGTTATIELRARHRDGSWRWLEATATNLLADPAVGGIVVNSRDVTERKEAEAALQAREARFRALVQRSSDVVAVYDADGTVRYLSPSVEAMLGEAPVAWVGRSALDLVHPDDRRRLGYTFARLRREPGRSRTLELRLRQRDGGWRWVEAIGTNLLEDPDVGGIVTNARDVTERKRLGEELAHQAFHDRLTGLPNRALFLDRLEHALARTARNADPLAVLFLDLDGFKVVNDSLGHEAGDALLVAVAERLRGCLRPGDTVARLGGDEFTILLEDADEGAATEVAERIAQQLRAPIRLAGRDVVVGTSVGIAAKTGAEDRPDDLLSDADTAMYAAKQRGKGSHAVFDPGMRARAWERLELEADLRRAVAHGEFRVFYQPIVELATGRVAEVEALVRWDHPERGLVPPAHFIPLAEETGLILPIGFWVLREACRQVRQWQDEMPGAEPLSVAVNLSPRMLAQPNLAADVARVLGETGLDPARLRLEITEGTMMQEGEATLATLERLKALGVRLAVDDFGTGYSSLAYLQRFPVDVLKIDRAFVARLGAGPEGRAIVRTVVALAEALGLAVTAEGIETAEQLAQVRELGADRGQGYYFARPLPAEDLAARLALGAAGTGVPAGVAAA